MQSELLRKYNFNTALTSSFSKENQDVFQGGGLLLAVRFQSWKSYSKTSVFSLHFRRARVRNSSVYANGRLPEEAIFSR